MGSIILIHEVYGVTENLLRLKRLLEKEGYRVLCPSLYPDGYVSRDEKKSYAKFYDEVGLEKGKEAIERLMEYGDDTGYTLIGFSVGATIAWLASRHEGVRKVLCVYGSRIRNYLDIKPRAQAYLFFCQENGFDIQDIRKRLGDGESIVFEEIEGEHGFYSKASFSDGRIQNLNKEILKILNEETKP